MAGFKVVVSIGANEYVVRSEILRHVYSVFYEEDRVEFDSFSKETVVYELHQVVSIEMWPEGDLC